MNEIEKRYKDNIEREVDIPDVVKEKAEEAFLLIKNEGDINNMKSKVLKKAIIGITSVAAVMGIFLFTCVKNPTWASGLPIIGGLFEKYEDNAIYKGDFTKMAEEQRQESLSKDGITSLPCSKIKGDITFTLKELYCNDKAIYGTLELKNKKGFSTKTVLRDYEHNKPAIQAYYDSIFGGPNYEEMGVVTLNGDFIDENTYTGVFRIDLTERKIKSDADKIKMNLNFNEIRIGQVDKGHEGDKILKGDWRFNFDINIDRKHTKTIDINTRNKDGVGMKSIDVTPYELILHDFYAEDTKHGKKPSYPLTFPVLLDANGKFMECGQPIVDNYPIYGVDVSKIDIYLCEYNEYMDELRGYKNDKNLKGIMEKKALYHTTVKIDVPKINK